MVLYFHLTRRSTSGWKKLVTLAQGRHTKWHSAWSESWKARRRTSVWTGSSIMQTNLACQTDRQTITDDMAVIRDKMRPKWASTGALEAKPEAETWRRPATVTWRRQLPIRWSTWSHFSQFRNYLRFRKSTSGLTMTNFLHAIFWL